MERAKEMERAARRRAGARWGALAAAAAVVSSLIGGSAGAGSPNAPTVDYVVLAGDTLWAVAGAHAAPGEDLRKVVYEIKGATGVASSDLHPGQILKIPAARADRTGGAGSAEQNLDRLGGG